MTEHTERGKNIGKGVLAGRSSDLFPGSFRTVVHLSFDRIRMDFSGHSACLGIQMDFEEGTL